MFRSAGFLVPQCETGTVASLHQWWGVFSLPVVSHLSFDGVFLRSFVGIIRDDLSTCVTFGLYGMHPCSLHWLGTVRV